MPKRFVKYHICDEEEQISPGVWKKTGLKKKEILDIYEEPFENEETNAMLDNYD